MDSIYKAHKSTAGLIRALAHGLSRTAISAIQVATLKQSSKLLAFCYNIGGGKFVLGHCPTRLSLHLDTNGAFSGAFVYLFNHYITWKQVLGLRGGFGKVVDGLSKGINGVYNKRGQILEDARKGFKGYLEGYRNVRDNAPIGIRLWLKGTLTITEMGATAGLSGWKAMTYDMVSGAYFDTFQTSRDALIGFYIKAYIDDLRGVPYYQNSLNPYKF